MKKLILIAIIAMMAPYLQAQKVSFKIKGSDTVLPLTQKEAEVYMKKNPNTSIMVTGGGSGVGISSLQSGTTDIAQASRSLKLDEKMKLNEAGNYAPSALLMPATGAIIQSVSQTKGAIGYVGLPYIEKSVKAIEVSYDKGKTYIIPSIANARNKSYPVTRPLFYYYLKTTEKLVSHFVSFMLSPEGQQIALEEGYVPVK